MSILNIKYTTMAKKLRYTDKEFIDAVKSSLSYAEVMKKIGLIPAGGNYDTVKRKIIELNLDTSHMTGKV
jgi:TPP-dependent indolepyruvate ferredoxin oxidoreductase alpha subunit